VSVEVNGVEFELVEKSFLKGDIRERKLERLIRTECREYRLPRKLFNISPRLFPPKAMSK